MTEPQQAVEDLVRASRRGDLEAFASLVALVRDPLLMTARAMLRDVHDAEDAVQETLVRAYRHVDSLRTDGAFRSWVFRILVRVCGESRRQPRPRLLGDRAGSVRARAAGGRPGLDLLVAEVERLPEKQRWPLSLHYLAGLDYREVAEVVGIPVGRVKSRLYEARRTLERKLGWRADDADG